MRPQFAQIIAGRNRSPGYLMQRSLRGALFPATDPSLRETTPASIQGITPDQVRAFHAATFRPDLTTIVVIGKITPAQARTTIENTSAAGRQRVRSPKPTCRLSRPMLRRPLQYRMRHACRMSSCSPRAWG